MAHLVDGVLSAEVVVGGTVVAAAGLAWGLKALDSERLPQAGVLSAAFFVASLVHLPVGPASVHLMLSGLLGVILGWAAVPAIFVALILQAVFFGYGGLTVLGVNTVIVAAPAILCSYLFAARIRARGAFAWGCAAGASAVAFTCLLIAAALALSGREYVLAAYLVILSHLPAMAIEGAITGAAVTLLYKVKPEILLIATRPAPRAMQPSDV